MADPEHVPGITVTNLLFHFNKVTNKNLARNRYFINLSVSLLFTLGYKSVYFPVKLAKIQRISYDCLYCNELQIALVYPSFHYS